ncbi:MAG: kelch repeat-containing protein [Planctomycetota bacterium]
MHLIHAALALAALAALSAPADAQLELCWSDGILGSGVTYDLSGGPGLGYALVPSLNGGPTPLALIDPTDPRLLDVGIDLIGFLDVGFLDATGAATASYPLPANPALAGFVLYAQAVDFPGAGSFFGDLSNRVELTLASIGDTHPAHNEDADARRFAPAAQLDDESWLIVGGETPGTPPTPLDSAVRFDRKTVSYLPVAAALPEPRSRASATALDDGRVLIAGGYGNAGVLASTVLYDPAAGTFSAGASMGSPRVLHTATKLDDGRVFVAGGSTEFTPGHPIGYPLSVTSAVNETTEIYDPTTDTWTPGPGLAAPVTTAEAERLSDGRVLIAGGIEAVPGVSPATTARCYLYDPGGGGLPETDPLPAPRQHIGIGPLLGGGVLVVGGADIDFGTLGTTVHDDTWIYDEGMESWGAGPDAIQSVRCGQVICTYSPKGIYILGGGLDSLDLATGSAVYSREVYALDETLSSWTHVGQQTQDRMGGVILDLDDGIHLVGIGSGGDVGGSDDKSADVLTVIDPNGC